MIENGKFNVEKIKEWIDTLDTSNVSNWNLPAHTKIKILKSDIGINEFIKTLRPRVEQIMQLLPPDEPSVDDFTIECRSEYIIKSCFISCTHHQIENSAPSSLTFHYAIKRHPQEHSFPHVRSGPQV